MDNQNNDFNNINNNQNSGFNNSFDSYNQNFRNNYNYGYNQNNYYQNQAMNYNRYNEMNKTEFSSAPPKQEKKISKKLLLPIIIILILASVIFGGFKLYQFLNKKTRTFMIYMVGSDLESKSKQGTYSIADIVGDNIDLQNNNVVLMVGGANEWHNFVNKDEIAIYRLTSNGFIKIESNEVVSMGTSENLTYFLDFVYGRYPAENYDLIFWNHGLGSLGLEQDEVKSDFISIYELDQGFKNSKFNDEKLEMTIFYNCLAANVQIASVMSKYSNYMVASEEILYLSRLLNRFSFLEKVKTDDNPYQIGYHFIEQSDKVINAYNKEHTYAKLDSTLSIFDLSKMDELNNVINEFFKTIDLNKYYYRISSARRNLHTYGVTQTWDYDTIDLYELVEALKPISTNSAICDKLLDEINSFVLYSSSLNTHSNGVSIYFPYFGSDSAIELHLNTFSNLWDNDYTKFINDFYEVRSGAKLTIRSKTGKNINELTNEIIVNNNQVSLNLTDEEKNKYIYANVYLFKKDEDGIFDLVLKTDDVRLEDNKLLLNSNNIMKINNNIVSYRKEKNQFSVKFRLSSDNNELDTLGIIKDGKITRLLLDSGEYPTSSIIELDDYDNVKVGITKYDSINEGSITENWNKDVYDNYIEMGKDDIKIKFEPIDFNDYYIMFELHDEYNDLYYSKVWK